MYLNKTQVGVWGDKMNLREIKECFKACIEIIFLRFCSSSQYYGVEKIYW